MKNKLLKYLLEFILVIVAIIFLYPLFLVVINSLKSYSEIMTDVVALPKKISFDNFTKAFNLMQYPSLFVNTLLVTIIGGTGIIIISAMAGYKLSRTKTRYSWILFLMCIAPMMIPFQSFMITLVKISKGLKLINSIYGLGIIYWGLGAPLTIFLYHGFVKSIPLELEESAIVDGCSSFRCFFTIIFPLLKPVTVSAIVINAMWIWNDFLLPLLMLNGTQNSKTLQLAAYNFFGQYIMQWQYAMAGVVLTLTPAILFYLAMQKHIIKGMIAGAVKG